MTNVQRRTWMDTSNTTITITIGGIGPPPLNNQCNNEGESGEEPEAPVTDSTAVGESTA